LPSSASSAQGKYARIKNYGLKLKTDLIKSHKLANARKHVVISIRVGVDLLDDGCHISKDCRVEQRAEDQHDHAEDLKHLN
jgi:hypothetical protein